jgi:hypothetical protein
MWRIWEILLTQYLLSLLLNTDSVWGAISHYLPDSLALSCDTPAREHWVRSILDGTSRKTIVS